MTLAPPRIALNEPTLVSIGDSRLYFNDGSVLDLPDDVYVAEEDIFPLRLARQHGLKWGGTFARWYPIQLGLPRSRVLEMVNDLAAFDG